jgi:Outer membrane protein beta-barrel domain
MKTTRKIGVVTALLVSLAFASQAQTTTPGNTASSSSSSDNEFRLSVGPEIGLPIGNFSNAYSWIFGGSVQADIPIIHSLYVTVNAGYQDAFVKSNEFPGRNLQLIPVVAGLKYFIVGNLIYVQAQAGATFLGNKSDAAADKSTGFTYTPQVGVLLPLAPKNYLDIGFRFEQTKSFYNEGSNFSTLGLRVAYSFGL